MNDKPTTAAREATKKALDQAIKRIQQGATKVVPAGTKLCIAAVAKEAGVSNSTIHNRYPEVAIEIRKLVGSTLAQQIEFKRGSLKDCSAKLAKARQEIERLRGELARSQSINLRLVKENELLRKAI